MVICYVSLGNWQPHEFAEHYSIHCTSFPYSSSCPLFKHLLNTCCCQALCQVKSPIPQRKETQALPSRSSQSSEGEKDIWRKLFWCVCTKCYDPVRGTAQNAECRMVECRNVITSGVCVCVCVCVCACVHACCTYALGKTYWKTWHYNNIQIEIRRTNPHFRKPGQCVHDKGQREPLVEDFASGLGWGHTLLMPGWGSCVGALISKLDCW